MAMQRSSRVSGAAVAVILAVLALLIASTALVLELVRPGESAAHDIPDAARQQMLANYQQNVANALAAKAAGRCPMCNAVNQWSILGAPITVPIYDTANHRPSTNNKSMAVLTCQNCGWTAQFNLDVLQQIALPRPAAPAAR